jgi:hypothetical protein
MGTAAFDNKHPDPMFRTTSLSILLAALCLPFVAHAGDDDVINPDRPDVTESSKVVGKGRFQIETGVEWDRQRDAALHERTVTTPTLLRIGVGESTELRIETDGRTIVHDSFPGTGQREVTAGYADTELGLKWQLAEQNGKQPSLGVLLHAALPSGSRDLRGHGLRPSLLLAADWELAGGYSLSVMPGLGTDSDDDGARYGYGVLAASLSKEFKERLHGFVEVATPQIARAAHGGTQALLDFGVAYLVNKDVQVDAMVVHGLNKRTPDVGLGFGLSVRL